METKGRSNRRPAAMAAGLALIVMAAAAAYAYGYVHGGLVVQGGAEATWRNLLSSGALFRTEIAGWFVILAADIVAAWALYLYLKPVRAGLALLGAWFRLVYAAVLGMAVAHLIEVMRLAGRADAFGIDRPEAHAMFSLHAFEAVWSFGLILFGGHLLIIGVIAWRAAAIPRIFGVLLPLAGFGYMVVHLGGTFLGSDARIVTILEYIFTIPMVAGELGFGLWLLIRARSAS